MVIVAAVRPAPQAVDTEADPPLTLGPAAHAAWRQHPPRAVPTTWPATTWSAEEVICRLLATPFARPGGPRGLGGRHDLRNLLDWLDSWPGQSWQERWQASGAEDAIPTTAWRRWATAWLDSGGWGRRDPQSDFIGLGHALVSVICADVLRPSLRWLSTQTPRTVTAELARTRDPDGFAALDTLGADDLSNPSTQALARRRIAAIVAAKGGTVADITVGDCLELLDRLVAGCQQTSPYFYQLLHALGVFPDTAPPNARALVGLGQRTVEQLIDQYRIQHREIRDLLVDYLREREATLDYTSLRSLAYTLGQLFWADLERHHPGIASLQLPPDVAAAWRRRVATKRHPDRGSPGTSRRADGGLDHLATVRAFYLDLAQWATDDPARWGRWVAPCPIRNEEMSRKKDYRRRKSRMDQRTRERLPVLPVLAATVDGVRRTAAERLAVAARTSPGDTFTVGGETLRRAVLSRQSAGSPKIWAEDPDNGMRRELMVEEHRAFWTWATVEVLRHTGIRIEELTELSHHSLVSYHLPSTGEVVPLLQIAPSKSDAERLLVISPELADVLATIVARVRADTGAVPLVVSYDPYERVWNSPMPLLFQRQAGIEHRQIEPSTIRRLLGRALAGTGLTVASGEPLRYTPHDIRRIFITDAVMNGLPPHIAQVIAGHQDINTTLGYKAVYPEEVMGAHRAFLARRRAARPSEEYRVPTAAEWEEFLGHFERRRVAYGTCARAFATPCIHEHACLRCPMLWPDPTQRARLIETIENLRARIDEAHREGWLGEVEGLKASLAGAEGKLAQLDRQGVGHTAELAMPARKPERAKQTR
jgi:hypothetical protein